MQAGRELDAKVAEALGFTRREEPIFDDGGTINGYVIGDRWYSHIPGFSTSWEGMGVLVEEAKKRGVFLEFSHALGGGYYGLAGCFEDGEYIILHNSSEALSTAQHAVCLIFLEAMQIAI